MSVREPSLDIFDEIEAGIWDEGLEALAEVIHARRKFVREAKGAKNMRDFQHGDPVRLVNISPKYLVGKTGTIDKTRTPNRRGDIMVRIDDRCYRNMSHRFSQVIGVPASSLELVS